jgi:ABC transport system ATP-binding/permease protein
VKGGQVDGDVLRVSTATGEWTLDPDRAHVVGRAREADIVIQDNRVSRRHLVLEPSAYGWDVRDTSANGLWRDGRRVPGADIRDGAVRLRLGAADGPELILRPRRRSQGTSPGASPGSGDYATLLAGSGPIPRPPTPTPMPAPAPVPVVARQADEPLSGEIAPPTTGGSGAAGRRLHRLRPGRLTVGRSRDNALVVDDLLASRHHAELLVASGRVEVVDRDSANGTFVNGQRVSRAELAQRDVLAIGHHLFQLDGDALVEYVDSGDVTFEVQSLSVFAGPKQLMHDMTFRLPGRSLLGVVGPSGAGKSTLLNALTGFRPADAGSVHYAGRDLYAEYDELRRRIGYVPQADPLHSQLTVRQALEYGAELRFPPDTTADERRSRVGEVISQLGLDAHAATPVHRLSGGQRKRTSVALELLTRPTLMFLDEPTSGLDPANDQSVMEALRGLAKGDGTDDQGRTVIVVTHSVLFLDLCDYLLVVAPGGYVAYFGPSDGALQFFGKRDFKEFANVFRTLEETPGEVCAARFRASEHYVPSAVVAPAVRRAPPALPNIRQQSVPAQLSTLVRRYLRVIVADRSYLRLVIAFPILLGIIPRVIPAPHGLDAVAGRPNPDATKVLVVLILCACFMGMANSVREIVKERPIYRRERTIGLSRGAYLGSKIVVLTALTTLQCIVFALIGLLGRLPARAVVLGSPLAECLVAVVVAAVASMMIGLLVSTLVDNADKTMPVLVLVTMGQLVLSGGLVAAAGRPGLEQVSWIAPARWGFAALGATDDLNNVAELGHGALGTGPRDSLWNHTASTWIFDIAAGAVIGLVALGLTMLALRSLEPKVGRARAAAPAATAGNLPDSGLRV